MRRRKRRQQSTPAPAPQPYGLPPGASVRRAGEYFKVSFPVVATLDNFREDQTRPCKARGTSGEPAESDLLTKFERDPKFNQCALHSKPGRYKGIMADKEPNFDNLSTPRLPHSTNRPEMLPVSNGASIKLKTNHQKIWM